MAWAIGGRTARLLDAPCSSAAGGQYRETTPTHFFSAIQSGTQQERATKIVGRILFLGGSEQSLAHTKAPSLIGGVGDRTSRRRPLLQVKPKSFGDRATFGSSALSQLGVVERAQTHERDAGVSKGNN